MIRNLLAAGVVLSAAMAASGSELPLLVGGHAHGAENIRILKELDVGNFVWIPKRGYGMGNTPWDDEHDILADVDACARHGLHFMISQRRGLGPAFKPGGGEYGGDTTPEIHDAAAVREILRRTGPLFVGLHAEELDADLVQNALRASYRSRIPHIYAFADRAGGRASFEGELARIGAIYHGYAPGVRYLPNLCTSLHHSGYRAGGDVVMAEFLESLPAVELQLAYLRGGARQFGKPWGVWVSPWYWGRVPCEDTELWPNPIAGVGEGHPASAFRRCLYLAYGSGARVLTLQETEPIFARTDSGEGYRLAAWGRELKDFWDYAREHDAPLEPLTHLAILVDRDSGWVPGPLHGGWVPADTVWGKLRPGRGDVMLAAYLDVLLPGYGRREPGLWGRKGVFYPGYFASSPGGPFDVLSCDVPAAVLKAYRHVFVLGDIAMTDDLRSRLRAYAAAGGRLYVNVNQMRLEEAFVQDPELLGAAIGETYEWSSWAGGDLLMRRIRRADRIAWDADLPGLPAGACGEPGFLVQDVQPGTAEVVARDGAGLPVLLRNRFGEGEVWLSTPGYLLPADPLHEVALGFFRRLLAALADDAPLRLAAADADGPAADVSWTAARQGADCLVVAANHGDAPRTATVLWGRPCREARVERGEAALSINLAPTDTKVAIRVPPEDVVVVRLRPGP